MLSQNLKKFDSVLQELISTLDALAESLRAEREAIIEYNLKKLTEVYKSKSDQLSKIQSLNQSRQTVLQALGNELGFPGAPTTDWLIRHIPDPTEAERMRQRVSCLKSLAQAIQEFNETQKQYIVHSLNSVEASLNLLDSLQGRNRQSICYNKEGMTGNSIVQNISRVMRQTL